ncbi:hypothetical protein OBBRIDRAFT_808690, partial [Obba rivulosa]
MASFSATADTLPAVDPRVAAALGGVASAFYVHKYPMRGDVGLLTEVALGVASFAYKRVVEGSGFGSAFGFALSIIFVHFASLALATVLYRISPLHPLYRFPGRVLLCLVVLGCDTDIPHHAYSPFVWKMTSLKLAQM